MMNCKTYKRKFQGWTEKYFLRFWYVAFLIHSSFIIHHSSFAQLGTWQTHVSYLSGQSVAVVENKIYAASQNGFFYYDKTTNETTVLGKSQGFSEMSIRRLLYLADQHRLLIAYQNGNLDFLTVSATGEPGAIKNVNTVVTSLGPVGISHINRVGNTAYISASFGVVVLDLIKDEIRDTYFTPQTGSPIYITAETAVANDSLYALIPPASEIRNMYQIRSVRLSPSVNIADPANWRSVTLPGKGAISLATSEGKLQASVSSEGVYERQNGKWTLIRPLSTIIVRQFPSPGGLILATDKSVTLPGANPFSGDLLADPREVVADGNTIWVADNRNGLLFGNNGTFQRIVPEGPLSDSFSSLYAYPNTLLGLGTQPSLQQLSIPTGRWQNLPLSASTFGFSTATYLPTEQKLYLADTQAGLWSYSDGGVPTRVTLPASIPINITSLGTDPEGNLWITTYIPNSSQATLHVRRPDGQFQSFPFVSQLYVKQVVADDNGFLWLNLSSTGILVVDPQNSRSRYLTTTRGQGGLLTNEVQTLVKDKLGIIWVGTSLGPMVFDNPAGAFDAIVDAQAPIINRRRLLANENILSIAVDGGNRKWMSTPNGVYRVAADGSQLLETFTTATSPLPYNYVSSVTVEPVSGMVFMQTPNGIISYRGPATEPTEILNKLTIFPNPVRPDFTGTVGINGLTDNSTVKILDAGGQLVYETRSQGGTATWNLRDYRNRPAQTGVYLVVTVTSDGSESLAGKLAVVR
ncbi:T9SS type A sorting domain-containing protein [Spirosoma sp. BT702]|uniref:T9SS type A sorting domain-containing protein n=1 Tax=Spirosoma profusum TaxID=2771354 RepID=A0A926Y2H1_9BACT|nr:two-component regulator propeller domain-containing protein [Spirosoma profusum]MBD2702513.1 T9SS type A sorting domain-containing protein [Spirosoma profusum]